MSGPKSAAELYRTDLERHMFAPSRRRRTPAIGRVADWLRDWIRGGWTRWKPLAEAAN
jgi:hypothetical protein